MINKYIIFFISIFSYLISYPVNTNLKYPIIYLSKVKSLSEDEIKTLILYLFNKKIRAFLNLISITEYTAINTKNNSMNTPKIKEYMVLFGGKIINDIEFFLCHPAEYGFIESTIDTNGNTLKSTASGRYQFLFKTWKYIEKLFQKNNFKNIYLEEIKKILENTKELYIDIEKVYKNEDDFFIYSFGPFWQDLGAIILMHYAGAINDILNDNFETAIFKLAPVWASLPKDESNLSYYNGQKAYPLEQCINILKEKIKNL
jgi:muramidase (phage lysozyme)